jgi:hypothetical protein
MIAGTADNDIDGERLTDHLAVARRVRRLSWMEALIARRDPHYADHHHVGRRPDRPSAVPSFGGFAEALFTGRRT